MLSLQSQKNIIASKDVRGTVTANLYNVTIKEALDAILKSNGFGYREKGNFIYVYTSKELADIAFDGEGKRHGYLRLPLSTHESAYGFVPIPVVVHLHGAEVPSAFDGAPESWFTPDGRFLIAVAYGAVNVWAMTERGPVPRQEMELRQALHSTLSPDGKREKKFPGYEATRPLTPPLSPSNGEREKRTRLMIKVR